MQKIEEAVITEPRWKKWFQRDNLIVMVLVGILLFVIALPTKNENSASKKGNTKTVQSADPVGTIQQESNSGRQEVSALDEYAAALEEKLETHLSAMDGVGSVEVMLTFSSSEELVVEKDGPTVRSNTVEKDSAGGSRTVSRFESGDTTVYSNASGDSTPYVVKTLCPRVEGVLVVAQGSGNSTINSDIVEAVQALFGVEAGHVKVVPMGSGTQRGSASNSKVTGLSGN